jgi:Sap, sulfolipid-1-addressing protein
MLDGATQVFLYGLLAGLSPLAVAATVAVMPSGRVKTVGFGSCFVAAQIVTCSTFVIIGVAATGSRMKSRPWLQATLEVVLAVALVARALAIRGRDPVAERPPSGRVRALVERLGRLRLVTTAAAGFVLGLGGPKRLVLTGLAATAIVAADLGNSSEALLVGGYVLVATALVWAPVVLLVLLGDGAVAVIGRAHGWAARRQPRVTICTMLALAALLAVDAVAVVVA